MASQAPGASIISYEGPNTAEGSYGVWAGIVGADAAQVVSASWDMCEPDADDAGEIPAFTTLFEQAASQGQTIVVASGDDGSEACFQGDGFTAERVDYPAADPWVTAAGGTSLFGPGDEVAWNWCQGDESTTCATSYGGQAAGGGGMSRLEPRPADQPGIVEWPSAQPCGTDCREVPDISANAGVGMVVDVAGSWTAYAGTSLAAPLLAGLVTAKNDGCATTTGLWTPARYALAAQGVYGAALTDITSGNTDMTGSNGDAYPAISGYDAATGLGSPRAQGLSCPDITAVSPAADPAGTEVTIAGLGLEKAAIHFGAAARIIRQTATSATVIVPPGSGSETVSGRQRHRRRHRDRPLHLRAEDLRRIRQRPVRGRRTRLRRAAAGRPSSAATARGDTAPPGSGSSPAWRPAGPGPTPSPKDPRTANNKATLIIKLH